jgi:hypothetical protein
VDLQTLILKLYDKKTESQFENPDSLDLTRENNKHLFFGQGFIITQVRRWRAWRDKLR